LNTIYEPSPEAEERFAQALDLILALILEDYENEQKENQNLEVKNARHHSREISHIPNR
jgi:antitoxin component HigA of HigAB toxin-antitoxin module